MSVLQILGASNHAEGEREIHDFYATDPIAVWHLLGVEKFSPEVLEPCCGKGHISKVLKEYYTVTSSDMIDRGYGTVADCFSYKDFPGDVITNPPYCKAQEIIEHFLKNQKVGRKIAMFLKVQFMESSSRKALFTKTPCKTIYVSPSRLNCAKNGDFHLYQSSALAYAWYIWEVGFSGETTLRWLDN